MNTDLSDFYPNCFVFVDHDKWSKRKQGIFYVEGLVHGMAVHGVNTRYPSHQTISMDIFEMYFLLHEHKASLDFGILGEYVAHRELWEKFDPVVKLELDVS